MNTQILDAVRTAVPDGTCIVALGGGADSSVLAWAASNAFGPQNVRGVFVYHGLEGSDALRNATNAVCEDVGIDCEVVVSIVADGGNLEARARAARYEAIESLAPSGVVALTGHTADDQAETVLMRLLRGSGTGGMSGIPYERGIWRRPLLGFTRAELRARALDLDLPFTDDPANTDDRFMRARLRHHVMPVLESTAGPDIRERILRSSSLLSSDDALLELAADQVPILPTVGGVQIPVGALASAPTPVASRVARRALRMVRGGTTGRASDVDAILTVALSGGSITISDAFQVVAEPPFVTICRLADVESQGDVAVRVGEPFTWLDHRYVTRAEDSPPPFVPGGRFCILDASVTGDEFSIRGFRPGDRLEIDTGSTPIKELLRGAGVPARMRPHSLTVTVGAKIAAVVGVRVAQWARPVAGESVIIIEREVGT